jgi:peroxiredoxin
MKILITVSFLFLAFFGFAQQRFTLKGTIKNINPDKVFIEYQSVDSYLVDSATIQNNKFSFTGNIDGPTYATLWFVYKGGPIERLKRKKHFTTLFLEKGVIKIVRDSNAVKFYGSEANTLYLSFQKKTEFLIKELNNIYDEYYRIYSQKDTTGIDQITIAKENVDKKVKSVYREEFLRDPTSPIAVQMLNVYTSAVYERDGLDIDTLFAKLPLSAKSTSAGIALAEKLAPIILCRVGNIAPDFIMNDTAGAPVSLSSFRGNYLLIDFWASWCGPCRKENPFYVSSFKKYSKKGFQILSVSLDDDKSAWIKAIRKDSLCWTQVSDLKFFENTVAVQYGIKGIPRNFLIDPDGKIIAKDLRGLDLEERLAKLLQ